MSELALVEETTAALLDRDADAWQSLEEAGLTEAWSGSLQVAAASVRAAARSTALVPLAETTLLGGWLLASTGLEVPAGPLTAAILDDDAATEGYRLHGRIAGVPWARSAVRIVVYAQGLVMSVPTSAAQIEPGSNLAGEPRDDVHFTDVVVDQEDTARAPAGLDRPAILRRGALARSIAITGALDVVLASTIDFVRSREQFGRRLADFQAVQQQLAEMAGEVAAAHAAVEAAIERDDSFRVAVAKVQAGRAATRVAQIAHQLHGAIGITYESHLHLFTKRLWAWRDEYGSEAAWASQLGREVAAAGGDGLWSLLSEGGPDE
jgi:acyl-CoA dehydrogenase